jgi:FkbM family methyltransferase
MGGVVTYEELVTLDRFKSAYPGSVPCVVDVGANVGDYLAEVFGRFPRAIAYAFEPQAAAAAEIRSRFASKHVIVEQCGLSDAPGRAELHASDSEACVLATLYERPDADSYHGTGVALNRRERVRLETLDRMIDGMPVDWLKIDVEGHELAVLRGGERLLAHTSVVQFEFNDCARIAGVRLADLHAFLWDRGFTVYVEEANGTLIHVEDPGRYAYTTANFLAVSAHCGWWR